MEVLRFFYVLGVIYCDLKFENVFVWLLNEFDDLYVKFIDFGIVNFVMFIGFVFVIGILGIYVFEMLECVNKEEYILKVDVYLYGILLYKFIMCLELF